MFFKMLALGLVAVQAMASEPEVLQAPPLPEGSKLCVIGDAGSGKPDQYLVAGALAKEGCERVIYVGDVIYDMGLSGPDDPQFTTKFYDPYKPLLEGGVPFYMAMGNHDYAGKPGAWLTLAQRHPGKIIFPAMYYAEQAEDVCFLALDTNTAILSRPQIQWAQEAMNKMRLGGCQLSFAFGHHPYWSVGSHGDAGAIMKPFLENVMLGKVDAYLAGHDHILSDETSFRGTRLLVSGAAGKSLYATRPARAGGFAKSALGYITITILREKDLVKGRYDLVQVGADGATSIIHSNMIEGKGIR